MSKDYFVKVSYTDKDQPLNRIHENHTEVSIDFSRDIYIQVLQQVSGKWDERPNFTVDFIFEIPEV